MKILVGYDGTNVAKEAVLLAQKHAKIFDAEIEVITAMPQNHHLGYEEIQGAEDKLERGVFWPLSPSEMIYQTGLAAVAGGDGAILEPSVDIDQRLFDVRRDHILKVMERGQPCTTIVVAGW